MQETRVSSSLLKTLADCKALGARTSHYRSFWAFNQAEGLAGSFNGVATWVRNDLAQHARATQTVMRDDMDKQGRCLLVDLGALAIFNVYAPNVPTREDGSAEEESLRQKVRFLQLLQERVEETRKLGKQVLICGDLNVTYRLEDAKATRLPIKVYQGCVHGRKDWALSEEAVIRCGAEGLFCSVNDAVKALQLEVTMTVEVARSCVHALHRCSEGWRAPNQLQTEPPVPAGRILMGITGDLNRVEATATTAKKVSPRKLWSRSATDPSSEPPAQVLAGTACILALPIPRFALVSVPDPPEVLLMMRRFCWILVCLSKTWRCLPYPCIR